MNSTPLCPEDIADKLLPMDYRQADCSKKFLYFLSILKMGMDIVKKQSQCLIPLMDLYHGMIRTTLNCRKPMGSLMAAGYLLMGIIHLVLPGWTSPLLKL